MSTAIPTKIEKCKGAMIATAIGDALGWPNEASSKNMARDPRVSDYFVEWTRRCGRPYWHNEKILPGEYSDDTQITLSVARSIIAGNWEEVLIQKEFPYWLGYERGGGKALLRAANSCKKGVVLWQSSYKRDYFNAGGNGAVMRILPHVIAAVHSSDLDVLMTNVIRDCIITHGHPRAVLGATCYAYALDYLLRKETVLEYGELVAAVINGHSVWGAFPDDIVFGSWIEAATRQPGYDLENQWDVDLSHMLRQLEYIRESLKKGLMIDDTNVLTQLECFTKVGGAGDVAILAAIFLFSRYANNPALGIKVPAFCFGADTDTIASITGGLLGMLCGINWIPTQWRTVQDYDCIVRVTELLLSPNSKEATKTLVSRVKERTSGWETTPIGMVRQLSAFTTESGKSTIVAITKCQSVLGQTMYFKDYRRNEPIARQSREQTQLQPQPSKTQTQPEPQVQAQVQATASQKQKPQRQFMLRPSDVATLLGGLALQRITFRKVLQIVDVLLAGNESSDVIAKRFNVEHAAVELIRAYVR